MHDSGLVVWGSAEAADEQDEVCQSDGTAHVTGSWLGPAALADVETGIGFHLLARADARIDQVTISPISPADQPGTVVKMEQRASTNFG